MTESEWLNCTTPDDLYLDRFACTPKPWRKLTLFACGCCRQIWEYITDPRCRNAVEVAELCADKYTTLEQLDDSDAQYDAAFLAVEEACDEIQARNPDSIEYAAAHAAQMAIRAPSDAYAPVAWVLAHSRTDGDFAEAYNRYLAELADLFRDVFSNPFRTPNLQHYWLTPEVTYLAQLIYEQRNFYRMHELADALEHAGCHDREFLDHCQSRRFHIRGCWVVDLLLNKHP